MKNFTLIYNTIHQTVACDWEQANQISSWLHRVVSDQFSSQVNMAYHNNTGKGLACIKMNWAKQQLYEIFKMACNSRNY